MDKDIKIRIRAVDETSQATQSAQRNLDNVTQKAENTYRKVQNAYTIGPQQSIPIGSIGARPEARIFPNMSVSVGSSYLGIPSNVVMGSVGSGSPSMGTSSNYYSQSVAVPGKANIQSSRTVFNAFGWGGMVGGVGGAVPQMPSVGATITGGSKPGPEQPKPGMLAQTKTAIGSAFTKSAVGSFMGGLGIGTAIGVGAEIIDKIFEQIKETVSHWNKVADAHKELARSIKSAGDGSKEMLTRMKESSQSISDTYGMDRAEVASGMGLLARMSGMVGTNLTGGYEAAVGIGAQYGMDTETAIRMLAKAKAGHFETLSRYGVQLKGSTAQEKYKNLLSQGQQKAAELVKPRGFWSFMGEAWEPAGNAAIGAFEWLKGATASDVSVPSAEETRRKMEPMLSAGRINAFKQRMQSGISTWAINARTGLQQLPGQVGSWWTNTQKGFGRTNEGLNTDLFGTDLEKQIKDLEKGRAQQFITGNFAGAKLYQDRIKQAVSERIDSLTLTGFQSEQKKLTDELSRTKDSGVRSALSAKIGTNRADFIAQYSLTPYQFQLRQMQAEQAKYAKDPEAFNAMGLGISRLQKQHMQQFALFPFEQQLEALKEAKKDYSDPASLAGIARQRKEILSSSKLGALSQLQSILQLEGTPMQTYAPAIESRFLTSAPKEANPLTVMTNNQKELNEISKQIKDATIATKDGIQELLTKISVAEGDTG